MLIIRADLLVNGNPYSITREAFAQFREIMNGSRSRKLTDSKILDRLGDVLATCRPDYAVASSTYELEGDVYPLISLIGHRKNVYFRLGVASAKYPTVTNVEVWEGNEDEHPLAHEVDVNGVIVGITDHALQRFVQRWQQYEKDTPTDPLKQLTKMLRQAEEDVLSPVLRVLRLINNGVQQAVYLRYGPWRMVLVESSRGNTTKALATFERRLRL